VPNPLLNRTARSRHWRADIATDRSGWNGVLSITLWQSLNAIEAFAGRDVEVAVVPQSVQAMMVSYDRSVAHYEVAHTVPLPPAVGA